MCLHVYWQQEWNFIYHGSEEGNDQTLRGCLIYSAAWRKAKITHWNETLAFFLKPLGKPSPQPSSITDPFLSMLNSIPENSPYVNPLPSATLVLFILTCIQCKCGESAQSLHSAHLYISLEYQPEPASVFIDWRQCLLYFLSYSCLLIQVTIYHLLIPSWEDRVNLFSLMSTNVPDPMLNFWETVMTGQTKPLSSCTEHRHNTSNTR